MRIDLGKRLLGNRGKEWKEKDRKLVEKLSRSTNIHENVLGLSIQILNLQEDISLYYLLFVVQFLLLSILVLLLLLTV